MIEAVIFDHDGTLVDSEGKHFELWREVLLPFGIDFGEDEYKTEHSGIPTLENAQVLVDKYRMPISVNELFKLKESNVEKYLLNNAFELIPGVIACMRQFAQAGLKMAIATGARKAEIKSSLSVHGFDKYIAFAATSEDAQHSKPAPDVYKLAAEKIGVACEKCIAIEDSATGLKSARAAGMECIVVRNAWSISQNFDDATAIVDTIKEAAELVLKKAYISKPG